MKGFFPLGRTERMYGQRLETGIFIEWPCFAPAKPVRGLKPRTS